MSCSDPCNRPPPDYPWCQRRWEIRWVVDASEGHNIVLATSSLRVYAVSCLTDDAFILVHGKSQVAELSIYDLKIGYTLRPKEKKLRRRALGMQGWLIILRDIKLFSNIEPNCELFMRCVVLCQHRIPNLLRGN
jgi:hypothetical protein